MTRWRTFMTALVTLIIILGVSAAAMAGQVRQDLTQDSTLEQILRKGTIKIGFSTFVPWAMKDKNGEFIGFEIDVARQLAEDMGVKVQFVPTKWDGIVTALLSGKFDVLIGGMGVTPERNLKVNFTIPYEYSGMSIVASSKLAPGYNTLEQFNNPDVVIAVRLGSTAHEAAKKFFPKAQLKPFTGEAETIQELLNGKAHAVVASAPMPAFTSLDYPEKLFLPIGTETFTREPIGFAIRKGDPDFMNFLDNWIRVKTDQGWLQERYDYWFTSRDWKSLVE